MKKTSLAAQVNKKILLYVSGLILLSILFSTYELNSTAHSTYKQVSEHLVSLMKSEESAKGKVGIATAVALAQDSTIKEALITKKRAAAIKALQNLSKEYKNGTPFHNIKVHIHTADVHSFIRAWKPKKFGDDLSGFRNTILKVKDTKKPLYAIEIGRAGLVMRGLSPIFKDGKYIGSLEFIQGLNSVVKSLKKQNIDLLVLMDEKYKRGNALTNESKLKNYYISQKVIDSSFRSDAEHIDFAQLQQEGYAVDNNRLYTTVPVKDLTGKQIGIYLISQKLSDIDGAIQKAQSLVYIMTGVYILIIVIILLLISMLLKTIISNELKKLDRSFVHFLDFISYKTNQFKPEEVTTNDEIGELVQKINTMAAQEDKKLKNDMQVMGEIVLVADKIEQGIYGCRVKTSATNPMIQTLGVTLNKMIEAISRDMTQLKQTLESYSTDDFRPTVTIDSSLKADMLSVMRSVNILGDKLRFNAKTNLTNGQTLNANAIAMSDSVQNVAAKANQQAASLEETAAAVEEITSITRNNAQNSTKMAQLGELVKNSANQGHDLANDTAASMDEINEQVSAINDAISVIDQIAFQTNILSLNAAVEAATAGEAGKGFAVVAQEVRNLASRSAEAANEIKALVEHATQKANDGKQISSEMISGYETLNEHISQTIHIIEDVSNASKEQMTGIEQINDAVTMLDRVTQENASEASNVANIAAEVRTMADELVADAQSKKF